MYRRLMGRFGRGKNVPAAKDIQEHSFADEGVLTPKESKRFQYDVRMIRSLCDQFGWDMMAIGPISNSKVEKIDAHGFRPVGIGGKIWYGFGAITPDGAIVNATGVYRSETSFRSALPVDPTTAARFQRVDKSAVDPMPDYYDDLDPSIIVDKIGQMVLTGDYRNALMTVDDVPFVVLAPEQTRRSQSDIDLGVLPSTGRHVPIATDRLKIACPKCGVFYRDYDANFVNMGMACTGCGANNDVPDLIVGVNPKDVELLTDDAAVRQRTWYHVSTREDWMGEIAAADITPVVHLGTRESAEERIEQIGYNNLRIYQIRLHDDIPISPVIEIDDTGNQPHTIDQLESNPNMVNGANRYINSFEDCGSVSLMVNPTMFTVIDSKPMKFVFPF
jgi:predicted RNA-binding Zn-ribbon protein involved in translation (DUF1610 family)